MDDSVKIWESYDVSGSGSIEDVEPQNIKVNEKASKEAVKAREKYEEEKAFADDKSSGLNLLIGNIDKKSVKTGTLSNAADYTFGISQVCFGKERLGDSRSLGGEERMTMQTAVTKKEIEKSAEDAGNRLCG